jgi:N-acylneuraminate cytidylyltransferase
MIIGFIPARSGSKSIPDKNIKLLGGKPLLAYTIESAFKAGLSRVIVNSDSEEYLKIAREYGAEAMLRPKELAQDNTSMYEVLKNEIPKIELESQLTDPLIIVLLSPTVPFRKSVFIKTATSFFINNLNEYDSLMAVQKVPDEYNPAQVIINTPSGLRMADGRQISNRIARRQEYPGAYVTSQGLYIFKTSNLEKGSFYGDKTMLLECDKSLDLNTLEDWNKAEEYVINRSNNKNI